MINFFFSFTWEWRYLKNSDIEKLFSYIVLAMKQKLPQKNIYLKICDDAKHPPPCANRALSVSKNCNQFFSRVITCTIKGKVSSNANIISASDESLLSTVHARIHENSWLQFLIERMCNTNRDIAYALRVLCNVETVENQTHRNFIFYNAFLMSEKGLTFEVLKIIIITTRLLILMSFEVA